MEFEVIIKDLFDSKGNRTGVIVSAKKHPSSSGEYDEMETIMKHYVHERIFFKKGVTFYPDHKGGLVSFIALIGVNEMKEVEESLNYTITVLP